MFEAEEDGAIVEDELAVILRTALGVVDLTVCDVFRAIDAGDTGKITFDDFRRFMEKFPNFVDQYRCVHGPETRICSGPPETITDSFYPDLISQDQNTANTHSKKHD